MIQSPAGIQSPAVVDGQRSLGFMESEACLGRRTGWQVDRACGPHRRLGSLHVLITARNLFAG